MTIAEAASNACANTWIDIAARKPAIFLASTLLCPGVPWAPPPMIVSAAMDALTASTDPSVWPALCGALGRQHVGHAPPTDEEIFEALMAMTEPMIEACEAGAFAHTLLNEEVIVLAAPAVWTNGRRLHRADGAALAWSRTKLYAWKGVLVPEEIIIEPRMITPDMIGAVPDQQLQH